LKIRVASVFKFVTAGDSRIYQGRKTTMRSGAFDLVVTFRNMIGRTEAAPSHVVTYTWRNGYLVTMLPEYSGR